MQAIENTKILDVRFNKVFIITSVTSKRVNLDNPGCKYTTSTGRSSSKFFVGHDRYKQNLEKGVWKILD